MKKEKEFLENKFVEFQLKIDELARALKKQEQTFKDREKEMDLHLFELVDSFENLDENTKAKQQNFDKTTRILVKNMGSIHRKIIRFLEANHKFQMEFPDNKARMDYCEVVETREMTALENETILCVVKKGYIDRKKNIVLRKAQVVTVLNGSDAELRPP